MLSGVTINGSSAHRVISLPGIVLCGLKAEAEVDAARNEIRKRLEAYEQAQKS